MKRLFIIFAIIGIVSILASCEKETALTFTASGDGLVIINGDNGLKESVEVISTYSYVYDATDGEYFSVLIEAYEGSTLNLKVSNNNENVIDVNSSNGVMAYANYTYYKN